MSGQAWDLLPSSFSLYDISLSFPSPQPKQVNRYYKQAEGRTVAGRKKQKWGWVSKISSGLKRPKCTSTLQQTTTQLQWEIFWGMFTKNVAYSKTSLNEKKGLYHPFLGIITEPTLSSDRHRDVAELVGMWHYDSCQGTIFIIGQVLPSLHCTQERFPWLQLKLHQGPSVFWKQVQTWW